MFSKPIKINAGFVFMDKNSGNIIILFFKTNSLYLLMIFVYFSVKIYLNGRKYKINAFTKIIIPKNTQVKNEPYSWQEFFS